MTAGYLRIKVYLRVAYYSPARDHRERAKRSIVVDTDAADDDDDDDGVVVALAEANFCFSEKQIKRPGNNGVSPSFLLVAGSLALLFVLRNQEEELISLAVYRRACFLFLENFFPQEYIISLRIFSYKYWRSRKSVSYM